MENHFFSLCFAIMDYTKFYIALWHQRAVQPPVMPGTSHVMFNYMLGDEIKGSVYAETKSWSVIQTSALLAIDDFIEAIQKIKISKSDQIHFVRGVSCSNS